MRQPASRSPLPQFAQVAADLADALRHRLVGGALVLLALLVLLRLVVMLPGG